MDTYLNYLFELLIKDLIHKSYIRHILVMYSYTKSFLVNNVLREYNNMKEKVKKLKTPTVNQKFCLFIKQC